MDKTWQKNFLAFLALSAAILGVAAYFRAEPSQPAQAAVFTQADLDSRLSEERKNIMQLVIERTTNAEVKLDALKGTIQDFKVEMRDNFKKLDDRLYELKQANGG